MQRVINGEAEIPVASIGGTEERLLVTQKTAAELLSVSRVTIWRMTKDCALHPVEILPGTWRYRYQESGVIARGAVRVKAGIEVGSNMREKSAA